MERTKENATRDFMNIIYNSWTYNRMTGTERNNLEKAVEWAADQNAIKGDYKTRNMILNAIYHSFLAGLGYTGGAQWREPNPDKVPMF